MNNKFDDLIMEIINENKRKNQENEENIKKVKMNVNNEAVDKYNQNDIEYLTTNHYYDKKKMVMVYELEITFSNNKTFVTEVKKAYHDLLFYFYYSIELNKEHEKWVTFKDQNICVYVNYPLFIKTNDSNKLKNIYGEIYEMSNKCLKKYIK
jgi:hypothetical protein